MSNELLALYSLQWGQFSEEKNVDQVPRFFIGRTEMGTSGQTVPSSGANCIRFWGKLYPFLEKTVSGSGENCIRFWGQLYPDLGKTVSGSGENCIRFWGKLYALLGQMESFWAKLLSQHSCMTSCSVKYWIFCQTDRYSTWGPLPKCLKRKKIKLES